MKIDELEPIQCACGYFYKDDDIEVLARTPDLIIAGFCESCGEIAYFKATPLTE